jgi:hypothetical protein
MAVSKKSLRESIFRGGSDVMAVTRLYTVEEKLVCDLRSEINGDFFFRVPVLSNLGSVIDAPSVPWHTTKIPFSDLPRVLVTYRSSREQSMPLPVVVGVVSNKASKVVATAAGTAATQRSSDPGALDASLATAKAKVIARDAGGVDIISSTEFVARAKEIFLSAGLDKYASVTLAEKLADSLKPLYQAVNALLNFASEFPTQIDFITDAKVLPGTESATLEYEVKGMSSETTPPTPVVKLLRYGFTPYEGPSSISQPPSTDYDSPNVKASTRN